MYYKEERNFSAGVHRLPDAVAVIKGAGAGRQITGTVKLYEKPEGVLVVADIVGLPAAVGACQGRIFGFHIHSGESCTGNGEDPFSDAGVHYSKGICPHPYHAGDMPPLFSAGGRAFLAFLTDRFEVREVVGKTVILHDSPDDFTTQPAGNAGRKIACGVIQKT